MAHIDNNKPDSKPVNKDWDTDTCVHVLKTVQPFFNDVGRGEKNFEIRKDDRGFKVGHELRLEEFINGKLTGAWLSREIKYILRDAEQYGLMSGFCILGF